MTIYRRESDLFALLLRERHDVVNEGGDKSPSDLTVLCDMALDDGVHLEPQSSTPMLVKVVNTCEFFALTSFCILVDFVTIVVSLQFFVVVDTLLRGPSDDTLHKQEVCWL